MRPGRSCRRRLGLRPGPAPAPAGACPKYSAPFAVHAGELNLYIVDSGESPDRGHDKADVAAMSAQLDRLGGGLDLGRGWIITHRPVWGLVPVARLGPSAPFEVGL